LGATANTPADGTGKTGRPADGPGWCGRPDGRARAAGLRTANGYGQRPGIGYPGILHGADGDSCRCGGQERPGMVRARGHVQRARSPRSRRKNGVGTGRGIRRAAGIAAK